MKSRGMVRRRTEQHDKIAKVMGEYKRGDLHSSNGEPVRKPRQAIAIALSEAGVKREKPGRGMRPRNAN